MIERVNARLALLLTILAVLLVVLLGWFVVVAPERSKASALDGQIGAAAVDVAATDAFLHSRAAHQSVADLRRLRAALPDDVQMSEIVRQLAWASGRTGVRVNSLTPSALLPAAGAQAAPMTVTVTGRYFRIAEFMRLLRTQAKRLYAIDSISFSSSDRSGLISATLMLDAFVYGRR